MSRIGKAPIPIPQGVSVTINGEQIKIKGPKGELSRSIRPELKVCQEEGHIVIKRESDDRQVRALHGLSRTLVANMVHGVTQQFTKNMEIVGVGYRAAVEGKNLVLQLGYSHPVEIPIPEGVTVTVTKNVSMSISSADRQQLGDFCSFVRGWRPPEVYKGKGIKYADERIRRKAGKAAAKKK